MSTPAADGLLIVDKPAQWTSHDVVARGRRLAGTRKVGHAGTLDPMATGVLVLGLGRATRLLGHLALTTKGYDATIRLGQTTITDDADGDILQTRDASSVSGDAIEVAAQQLRGDLQQVPSSVSAVKIRGERAYARVRAGEDVTLPARAVHVASFQIDEIRPTGGFVDLDVHIECSTGTYVRALARDLGTMLGVGGHLTALRRTRVGGFHLHEAHTLVDLAEMLPEQLPVITLDRAAQRHFAWYVVDLKDVAAVRNGRAISRRLRHAPEVEEQLWADLEDRERYEPDPDGVVPVEPDRPRTFEAGDRGLGPVGPVAMLAPGGEFLALYEQHGPVAKAVAVFAPA